MSLTIIRSTRQHDACVFTGFDLEKARHALVTLRDSHHTTARLQQKQASIYIAMSFHYPINVYKDTLKNGDDIETLSNLTYNYQWPAVLEFLENHPDLVNYCRLTKRWQFLLSRLAYRVK